MEFLYAKDNIIERTNTEKENYTMTKDQIESKTFKKGLFGYNKDEVNSFLRSVAEDYAELETKYAALESENEVSKKNLMENSVKIYELETRSPSVRIPPARPQHNPHPGCVIIAPASARVSIIPSAIA